VQPDDEIHHQAPIARPAAPADMGDDSSRQLVRALGSAA
jgi:hypothetical protein